MFYINLHCICCWRRKYFTKQKDDDSSFQLTFFSPKFSGFFVVKSSQKGALPGSETSRSGFWRVSSCHQQCGEREVWNLYPPYLDNCLFQLGVLWSLELEAILTMKKKITQTKIKTYFSGCFSIWSTHQNPWLHVMPFPPVVPGTFLRVAWQKRFIGCHRIFVSIVCSEKKKHHRNRSNSFSWTI